MRKHLILLLVVLLLCPLCGCSSTPAVGEDRILSDVYANSYDLHNVDLEIVSHELIRDMNDEGDFEAVEVTYTAENNSAVYYGGIMLYYGLYDEEWLLNTYDLLESSYEPKESCPDSVPLDFITQMTTDTPGEVDILPMGSQSIDPLTEEFHYTIQWHKSDIVTQNEAWMLDCVFDLMDGWYVQDSSNEISGIYWDICGTYVLDNESITAQIDILDFQIDTATRDVAVTVSFSLTSHLSNDDIWGGPAMKCGTNYYTTSPNTVTISCGWDQEYYVFQIGDYVDVYICGEEISWDPIGKGTGVWIQVLGNYSNTYGEYWLYRQ